jgi:hypothetical protein
MKNNRKFIHNKEIINVETGEVIRHESMFIKEVKSDDFIRVYLNDLSGLMKLKGDIEFKILFWLWEKTGWNNEPIIIEKIKKQEIADKLEVKVQSISDALSRLVKKDVIIKQHRMWYLLNPNMFFKGEEKARKEIFNVNIQYKIDKKNGERE